MAGDGDGGGDGGEMKGMKGEMISGRLGEGGVEPLLWDGDGPDGLLAARIKFRLIPSCSM
jgi:hypothetical protein